MVNSVVPRCGIRAVQMEHAFGGCGHERSPPQYRKGGFETRPYQRAKRTSAKP